MKIVDIVVPNQDENICNGRISNPDDGKILYAIFIIG
jgi:hypothetical protein